MFNGRIPIDKDARVEKNGRFMTGQEVLSEELQKLKQEVDEIKEEIFSLTIDVERLQECEKMEQVAEQEKKYIVHRRYKNGEEEYISKEYIIYGEKEYSTTINIKDAYKFTQEEAIRVRNKKNEHYKNCLMLWVISEAK